MFALIFIYVLWATVLFLSAMAIVRIGGKFFEENTLSVFFRTASNCFRQFASQRALCMCTVILFAVGVRVAMLPVLGVPTPRIQDEFSYLLAADTFASGRLSNPTHAYFQFFESEHVLAIPTYMSKYPPAQGLTLCLGQLLGSPWIGVLLSFALMIGLIYWAALAFMPGQYALLAGVLPLVHPGIACGWLNTYWGGCVAAIGGALVFGSYGRLNRRLDARNALLMSLGLIILFNTRPYEGLCTSIIPVIALLCKIFLKKKLDFKFNSAYIWLPAILFAGALTFTLIYNHAITGNALKLPYSEFLKHYSPVPPLIFMPLGIEPVYSSQQLKDAYITIDVFDYQKLRTAAGYLDYLINRRLLSALSFFAGVILPPFVILAFFNLKDRRVRILWLSLLMMTIGAAAEVWWQKHYAGPITAAVYILLAEGFRRFRSLKVRQIAVGRILSPALLAVCVINFFAGLVGLQTYVAIDAQEEKKFPRQTLLKRFWDMPGEHLVFVHYADGHDPMFEYVYNLSHIDQAKVVWARDFGKSRDQVLLDYYPNRKAWLLDADGPNGPKLYTLKEGFEANLSKNTDSSSWKYR